MDIGVIGWWSYDNQGDLAMLAALRQGLAPHRVVAIDTGFPANRDTIYRLNRLDYVLLGGGTLIPGKPNPPFDTFDQWADELQCPLGVVGLGVDPFPERYWPAVEALLGRAEFFYVRDRASHTVLRRHPKVQVAPDLTFAYPLPAREECSDGGTTAAVCGVNLRRSGVSSFNPVPWLEVCKQLPVQFRGIRLSSFESFEESTLLGHLDLDSPPPFDAASYRELDLMIGTAFHSILFSVQAAVPVIAIDYAPKVRSFMEDNGLARWLLAPDEHERLPMMVDEVLAVRSEITADLYALRKRLHEDAQQSMRNFCDQIERSGPRHRRNGPTVTIVVVASGNAEADRRTLASCMSQTYEKVKIVYSTNKDNSPLSLTAGAPKVITIATDSQTSRSARLQELIASAGGGYLTWVDGGDWFADDALDCLVSRMEEEQQWDVAYTDYYAMSGKNLPIGYHIVPGPEKLFRRDVVGPSFLLRKTLFARMALPCLDTPLVAYGLWLQANLSTMLVPFHAPLLYSARPIRSRAFIEQEREVRRRWRQDQPLWNRAVWRVIDSDLGERFVVRPLARFRDMLMRRSHAQHS